MAKIEIEDTVYAELSEHYPDPKDLKKIASMQLAKLFTPSARKSTRKHCTVNLTSEQQKYVEAYCALHSIPRNDLMIRIVWEADPDEVLTLLGGPVTAPIPRRHRPASDGGDRPVSFSPTLECWNYWTDLMEKCHASRSLVLFVLLEEFRKRPLTDSGILGGVREAVA